MNNRTRTESQLSTKSEQPDEHDVSRETYGSGY